MYPATSDGRTGAFDKTICVAAEAAKRTKTTSPVIVGDEMSRTLVMKLGATAVNRPHTANPATAPTTACGKIPRTEGGTLIRCSVGRAPLRTFTVSGTVRRPAPAITSRRACTTKTVRVGYGANSVITPATSGPRPKPPMLAAVAIAGAIRRRAAGAASMTATVAVLVKMPAENPETRRPTNKISTLPPIRNKTALASDKATPAKSIGRRPIVSENCPTPMSAAMTPTAYVAKMTVVIRLPKPNSRWYSG